MIFELGLSWLSRDRAFLMRAAGRKNVKLPTDTLGMTAIPYIDPDRAVASLDSTYSKLERHIEAEGSYNGFIA